MLYAMSLGFALLLLTTFIHFWVLQRTSAVLLRCRPPSEAPVLIALVGIFLAHILEISLYAGAYALLEQTLGVGSITGAAAGGFMDYFYYSIVMYTSLGLGDAYPVGHMRIISGIEALNGLVLIGWSASFTFLAMRRFWPLGCGS